MRALNNKSRKIKDATKLFWRCFDRGAPLNLNEALDCVEAIKRDPTGALRCYKAILNSYGG
jgi:hypothetical protein